MIPLTAFTLELPLDWWLIEKKNKSDLSWKWRTVLIALSCLACWWWEGAEWNMEGLRVIGRSVCLALVPYCWFDIALNKLRGKKWYYVSSTNGKWFDRQFAKFNPWFLLTLRAVGFGLLIFGWIMI